MCPLFWRNCYFIHMTQDSYRDFSCLQAIKNTGSLCRLNNSRFSDYIDSTYTIELDIRIHIQLDLLHTSRYWQWWPINNEMYDRRDDFNMLLLGTFHFYVATFQRHLHMEYTSLSWTDIPEFVVPIMISLIKGYCSQRMYSTTGF